MKIASELITEFLKGKKTGALSAEIVDFCIENNVISDADDVRKSVRASLSHMKRIGKVRQEIDGTYTL